MISIHGPDAATHDALTRTPGAFAQTLAGLQNLNALRSEFPLRINTSTVINQRNSDPDTLARTVALLLPMVDQLVFNVMQPFGRGDRFFDRLMLRYTDTAERLAALFARYRGRHLPVHLVDIPYCCTEGRGIPESARGYVERYVHYEPVAGPPCGRPDTPAPEPGLLAGGAQRKLAMLAQQEHPQGLPPTSSPLAEKHRDLQEQSQKVKREECRGCAYFSDCDGVWRNYVSRFGMEEFAPVRRKEA
jgi:MoaA/NifB/PqqE/SkfB family radical SAM enzyme